MIPIVIHTRRFPPRRLHAITLFPFVFHNDMELDDVELRHETVHIWQEVSLLIIGFYLLYLAFWIANLIVYRDSEKAYREIPFERSAYKLESQENVSRRDMTIGWLREIIRREKKQR